MSFQRGNLVEASDFNTLIGNVSTTLLETINGVFATGSGTLGYGQTPIQPVIVNNTVTAANEWNQLATNLSAIAAHQGTSVVNFNAPVTGNTVAFSSVITNNLSLVTQKRFNAALQGASNNTSITNNVTWQNELVFTHLVEFENGDAARYFFNTGGQLKLTVLHPTGPSTNAMFADLASNVGQVVISAPASGVAVIDGIEYRGVTQRFGGGNTPVIDTTRGYYGINNSEVTIFTQTASTGPVNYRGSTISVTLQTNGSQGINNDNGTIITVRTKWRQTPNDIVLTPGSITNLQVIFPETQFLSNVWGTVNVTGNVTST
jgi:hypothetical protein